MKTAKLWMALIVLTGVMGFLCAGCQSQPQESATNEPPANAASEPATSAAGESAAEAAAGPAGEPVRIPVEQLADVFAGSNVLLLDVRPPEEIEENGTVEGYLNIPIDELEARLDEVPRDRPILTA
jgi:hypothetical protein